MGESGKRHWVMKSVDMGEIWKELECVTPYPTTHYSGSFAAGNRSHTQGPEGQQNRPVRLVCSIHQCPPSLVLPHDACSLCMVSKSPFVSLRLLSTSPPPSSSSSSSTTTPLLYLFSPLRTCIPFHSALLLAVGSAVCFAWQGRWTRARSTCFTFSSRRFSLM